jgi:hypothetical protein
MDAIGTDIVTERQAWAQAISDSQEAAPGVDKELARKLAEIDKEEKNAIKNIDDKKKIIGLLESSGMSSEDADSMIDRWWRIDKSREDKISTIRDFFTERRRDLLGVEGESSSRAPTAEETKVINGVTYRKVPGGWQKVQ